jgi:hypothetical protein
MEEGMMAQVTTRPDPADDTFAFHVAVRSLAALLGASVMAATGVLDGAGAVALGAGLAAGVMAPRRWTAPLGGTAAAVALSTAFTGLGSPAAAVLVLPGALVGWWVMYRGEPNEAAMWPDGVLAGFAAEMMLLAAMGCSAWPIIAFAYLLSLGNGTAFGVIGALGFLLAAGWMHAETGRMTHRMLPGAFWKFAAGQALPTALFAAAVPEIAPVLMVVGVSRLAFVWFGYLRAEGVDRGRGKEVLSPES